MWQVRSLCLFMGNMLALEAGSRASYQLNICSCVTDTCLIRSFFKISCFVALFLKEFGLRTLADIGDLAAGSPSALIGRGTRLLLIGSKAEL